MDTFGKFVTSNRRPIEVVLAVLILIHFAPTEVLGRDLDSRLKSVMGQILSPIRSIMSNVFIRLFLWLALLWACCAAGGSKDMNLFFLVAIYFLIAGK